MGKNADTLSNSIVSKKNFFKKTLREFCDANQ